MKLLLAIALFLSIEGIFSYSDTSLSFRKGKRLKASKFMGKEWTIDSYVDSMLKNRNGGAKSMSHPYTVTTSLFSCSSTTAPSTESPPSLLSSSLSSSSSPTFPPFEWRKLLNYFLVSLFCIPLMVGFPMVSLGDDELANFAAQGNKVGVDGTCFVKKCALETSKCANDPNCLKGLSCLARCKGGSMCSTGCFAKYGSETLDNLLYCSVEKNDCVQVPGKENVGWNADTLDDLPTKPLTSFDMSSLKGTWYKIMGLDSRYDCFDCQRNSFILKDANTLDMIATFRIPKPKGDPGYLQNRIIEELHSVDKGKKATTSLANMQSQGRMFGLTFWENWYILGETKSSGSIANNWIPSALAAAGVVDSSGAPSYPTGTRNTDVELKLVYYTGHTLQGNYKGAFLYSRYPEVTPDVMVAAQKLISDSGLDPNAFCIIRNQCFLDEAREVGGKSGYQWGSKLRRKDPNIPSAAAASDSNSNSNVKRNSASSASNDENAPFWYLGQRFFQVTNAIGEELADWFEDPAIVSDWLIKQQVRSVLEQPLAVSPFAGLQLPERDE